MNSRYAKQALFLGTEGQEKIKQASVIIMGAGALGSASAEMLARAGIGKLTIVDRDYVEWSNLQRQSLYSEADVYDKLPKAVAASNRLKQINREIKITSYIADINASNVEDFIAGHSVIIDATDNFETRMVVNDAAIKHHIPFLFGACVASYGLTFPIIPRETPCLHCLLQHLPLDGMTCDVVGVISPIVQMVASYQVTQALKLLTGAELLPLLQSFDIWKNEKADINVAKLKNPNCPTCSENPVYPYLAPESHINTAVLCGRNAIQIRPGAPHSLALEQLAQNIEAMASDVKVNPYLLSCKLDEYRIVVFKDGRAIIHETKDESVARALYRKLGL